MSLHILTISDYPFAEFDCTVLEVQGKSQRGEWYSDLESTTQDSCKSTCLGDAECNAANYLAASKRCELFKQTDQVYDATDPDAVYMRKPCPGTTSEASKYM